MKERPRWQVLLNATGIILHRGLGPPLARAALEAVERAVQVGTPGELPDFGWCGRREEKHLVDLICSLTGAEDALVVNNPQAASFLVLDSLLRGVSGNPDVVVCGDEVLPDAFSLPLFHVLGCGGACLKRVGMSGVPAADVFRENTALVLSIGNRDDSTGGEGADAVLVRRAREQGIPAVKMMNYATLVDLTAYGMPGRMQVPEVVAEGFDVVVFRGDRLLGGPALGIVAGRRRLISALRSTPLAAAVSADRVAAAALEATLQLYLEPDTVLHNIPLLRAITAPVPGLKERAERLAEKLNEAVGELCRVTTAAGEALFTDDHPGLGTLPSYRVEIHCAPSPGRQLAAMLAEGDPPVVALSGKAGVVLDLRSVPEDDDEKLLGSLVGLLAGGRRHEMQVLDSVANPIWVLDRRGTFLFANKACEGLWGTADRRLTGRTIDEVVDFEAARAIREGLNTVLRTGNKAQIELGVEGPDGGERWLDITLAPNFQGRDVVGRITFTANDVTERKRTEQELKHISMHDPLTGLYNRAYFEEEMRRLDTERHYPVSVVVCDVDGLKLINDTLGHGKGDELLKTAAAVIRKPFRASDVVARVGGDEFVVLLPRTDEQTVVGICERIRRAVEEHGRSKTGIPLSLSLGFATGTDPSEGIPAVYKRADENMYGNKFKQEGPAGGSLVDFFVGLLAEKGLADENYTERLQRIVQLLGRAVGLSPGAVKSLLLLSKVYDVGKAGIDDSIIAKDGSLNPEEWKEIKRHPEIGGRIVRSSSDTAALADYILQHHEWWNGSGYPRGLKGKDIHLYARILAIADAYQAMISPRPYRPPLSHEEALAELKRLGGTQFDPRLVDVFVSLFHQEYLM